MAKLLMLTVALAIGDTGDAVVCIESHGGSGTIIATGEGWSYVLTVAHCFEGKPKKIKLLVPKPMNGNPQNVGITIVGLDRGVDLALLKLNAGPLPYVAPPAPPGYKPRANCLSVGYDDMKLAPQPGHLATRLPATIIKFEGTRTWTKEPPWHGRSGGALLDGEFLVGVVRAYTGSGGKISRDAVINNPNRQGTYISHTAIISFLSKYGSFGQGQATPPAAPRSDPFAPQNRAPIVMEEQRYTYPPPIVYGYQQPNCPPGGS